MAEFIIFGVSSGYLAYQSYLFSNYLNFTKNSYDSKSNLTLIQGRINTETPGVECSLIIKEDVLDYSEKNNEVIKKINVYSGKKKTEVYFITVNKVQIPQFNTYTDYRHIFSKSYFSKGLKIDDVPMTIENLEDVKICTPKFTAKLYPTESVKPIKTLGVDWNNYYYQMHKFKFDEKHITNGQNITVVGIKSSKLEHFNKSVVFKPLYLGNHIDVMALARSRHFSVSGVGVFVAGCCLVGSGFLWYENKYNHNHRHSHY
jgi:triacylglycerol esterase/lipase EstA (alpha/beta hydrolase family)